MSKSRKGKKASYNLAIKHCEKVINEKFKNLDFNARKELFKNLEEWAKKELGETQKEIFMKALYNAESTQDIRISIALTEAFNKIDK